MYLQFYINDNGDKVYTTKKESLLGLATQSAHPVAALEKVKRSFKNPPLDWSGDPCLPRHYSWTGVNCTEGRRVRVVSLNLSGMDLDGSLSPNLANLTALTIISLGHNRLSGPIPNLSSLRNLQILHLNDNQLPGSIPSSLGSIRGLRELFMQNNNLTGQVPTVSSENQNSTSRSMGIVFHLHRLREDYNCLYILCGFWKLASAMEFKNGELFCVF